jgi:hypothetical protein
MTAGLWAASPEEAPVHITSVVQSDLRTGKLIRSVVVTPKVVAPKVVTPGSQAQDAAPPGTIAEMVEAVSAEHSVSSILVHAVIRAESNYNPYAVSPKGALGLMQLIPATARRFGVEHVFDPLENLQGGISYLKYLLDLYSNDVPLALAAYNAGEAAVAKYNGVPPYPETQNYIATVRNNLEKLAAAVRVEPAPQPLAETAPPQPAGPRNVVEVVDPDGTVRYRSR